MMVVGWVVDHEYIYSGADFRTSYPMKYTQHFIMSCSAVDTITSRDRNTIYLPKPIRIIWRGLAKWYGYHGIG